MDQLQRNCKFVVPFCLYCIRALRSFFSCFDCMICPFIILSHGYFNFTLCSAFSAIKFGILLSLFWNAFSDAVIPFLPSTDIDLKQISHYNILCIQIFQTAFLSNAFCYWPFSSRCLRSRFRRMSPKFIIITMTAWERAKPTIIMEKL